MLKSNINRDDNINDNEPAILTKNAGNKSSTSVVNILNNKLNDINNNPCDSLRNDSGSKWNQM